MPPGSRNGRKLRLRGRGIPGDPPGDLFYSLDLRRAREARRLERDMGAGLDAAALILDLCQEVRQLKARLRALGEPPA
ncbi:curved DNA-binding protein [Bordetella pertussis]|nr:curved DNA-binding protein [Bordetella pertussis]